MDGKNRCVLSIDVEDWFHVLDLNTAPDVSQWSGLPSRVEANFLKLLELAHACGARTTCFFLGWVAQQCPNLVTAAVAMGHEIASHGYGHQLAFGQSRWQFRHDVSRAKQILEDVAGQEVVGYRCPGFSVSADNSWVFEELARAGYEYDSSVFPGTRSHGGWARANPSPHLIPTPAGSIAEFPITVERWWGRETCFFGGGYLRLFPLSVVQRMTRRVLENERPVIFYVHPREVDPEQPRLRMNPLRAFKSYVNLRSTEPKLKALMGEHQFITMAELGAELGLLRPKSRKAAA